MTSAWRRAGRKTLSHAGPRWIQGRAHPRIPRPADVVTEFVADEEHLRWGHSQTRGSPREERRAGLASARRVRHDQAGGALRQPEEVQGMLLLGTAIGDDAKGDAGSLQRVEDVPRRGIEGNAASQVLVAMAE
jgi:hypothetical protein